MFLMVANGCDSDPTVPGLNLSELSENSKLCLAITQLAFEMPALLVRSQIQPEVLLAANPSCWLIRY